jgi:hypothetical protein
VNCGRSRPKTSPSCSSCKSNDPAPAGPGGDESFQPFSGGGFVGSYDASLPVRQKGRPIRRVPEIEECWDDEVKVFAYVLTTVDIVSGVFQQGGSAPNFQGGLITLCTCMHRHRTWWRTWKRVWVAGFCGKNCPGGSQLFYLMQVGDEEDSHFDLWGSLLSAERTAKSASLNPLGDLYEPATTNTHTRLDPGTYRPPHRSHVHLPGDRWKQDICYGYPSVPKRVPRLLVGDPARSFVWKKPRYSYINVQHPRFKVYSTLGNFLWHLK